MVDVDQFRRNADYVERMGALTIRDEQAIKDWRAAADEIAALRAENERLLAEVKRLEGERDAAYVTIRDTLRNLASCKPWLKSRLPFTVAKSVADACDFIEAARKMGDE